jgi:hypothetical protein
MSRERELLKRVRDTLRGLKETYYDLYWDIQTVLAAPAQKPLTREEISYGFRTNDVDLDAESYWAGVRFAEKTHGIGGGE